LGTADRIRKNISLATEEWKKNPTLMSARELLRDAINHEDGRAATGSHLTVENDLFSSHDLSQLSGRPSVEDKEIHQEFTREKLKECIEVAQSLGGKETISGIIAVRENNKERKMIWDLLLSERNKRRYLARQMRDGENDSSILTDILGKNEVERFVSITSNGIGLTGLALHAAHRKASTVDRRAMFFGIAGFVVGSILPIYHLAERNSLISDGDYSGPFWPIVFALGEQSTTRDQLEGISDALLLSITQ
jgi:hypothetical protein